MNLGEEHRENGQPRLPVLDPIQVSVLNEQAVKVDPRRLADVARRTAASQHAEGEISITLVDPGRIARLNQVWMGAEGPTDVLSFPVDGFVARATDGEIDRPPVVIGEVVLCPEVARSTAPEQLKGELDLLVAHGVLHLLGFDHETEEAAQQMRDFEFEITGKSGASAT